MKLLLLGFSRIAQRRILPALARLGLQGIEVASVLAESTENPHLPVEKRYFTYQEALDNSRADLVYVSTINSLHAPLACASLRRGFHVIVDKPASLTVPEAADLTELAASKGKCVAEATVWAYHPQVGRALELFQGGATRIAAAFSFPPPPETDIRYQAEWGGGADNDLGAYALTPGRHFFGQPAEAIEARILSESRGVTTSFALLSVYPQGRSLTGYFGFDTSYVNQLQVASPLVSISMEKVFSPPAALPLRLSVLEGNEVRGIDLPPADTFELFMRDVFEAIRVGEFERFRRDLLADSVEREALRASLLRSKKTASLLDPTEVALQMGFRAKGS